MEKEDAPHLTFRYNVRHSLLRFWWQQPDNMDDLPRLLTRLLKAVRRYQAQQLLLDLRPLPPLNQQVQQWLQTSWLPRLRQCGLQRLALLLPTNTYNMIVVESILWTSTQEHLPYEVQYFTELPAALDWLTNSEVATSDADWPCWKQQPMHLRVRRRKCPCRGLVHS
ncbi:hypothetical protein MUN84_09715 [Hymenobacter sp. 5516J-16]|uniref:STAS/SEC14 domain-containing protein n=1 Tax=Hymenobacter sublimis TaxID=2933777 RepID=A0ABY4JAB7_9BACT|nr:MULTISPECIES: hypothetical protein [Hymenobacter]UOQ78778.1 hypothetical protein MUN84_09715 [Hymenobacter sp. 5516J-16]UPL48737.1 hypothetical protein MWH26_16300 [Hymenobacter sublimis]